VQPELDLGRLAELEELSFAGEIETAEQAIEKARVLSPGSEAHGAAG